MVKTPRFEVAIDSDNFSYQILNRSHHPNANYCQNIGIKSTYETHNSLFQEFVFIITTCKWRVWDFSPNKLGKLNFYHFIIIAKQLNSPLQTRNNNSPGQKSCSCQNETLWVSYPCLVCHRISRIDMSNSS